MSLVSSFRLSSLPSLSRRLVSSICLPSISCSSRVFSQSQAKSSSVSSSLISTLFSSSSSSARSFSTSLVAPGHNRLILSKNEAIEQLETEIRELTLPEDAELQTYITSNNLEVEVLPNEVRIHRSDAKAALEIRFSIMPDTDDLMNPDAQQQAQEEKKPDEQGEEQPPKPLKHSFMVQIRTRAAKNNFLHVNCHADEEGRIVVEHVATDEQASKKMFTPEQKDRENPLEMFETNSTKFLNFEDLPDGPAEKFFNLLCDFGIDDRLALFVQQYSYILRTKQQVEKVRGIADFITSIP